MNTKPEVTKREELSENDKVVERVRKLLALAERRGGNEAEAASAAAKAQELLAAYNLTMATVQQGGGDGRREDARQKGGMYIYERELWRAVAELNFCMYFKSYKWWTRKTKYGTRDQRVFQHRIVGREVNVKSTWAMAGYLQTTIERLCRERLTIRMNEQQIDGSRNTQYFTSWAVSWREGVADRLVERLRERRRDVLKKEAREAAERAKNAGGSSSTAITLASVAQREHDANIDFLYGDGTSARWAADRVEQAKANAAAEQVYAEWAKAHPEEAAAEAKKAQKEDRRSWRYRSPDARERRAYTGAYKEGRSTADKVGLDPQAQQSTHKRLT